MSFDKNSNFNREANFTGVKFGENKPVLEVELNELQEIQNEARADIVRDSIPSGFIQLGELDFDYMLNNENQVKLKTDSVAYVNGYKINIPKDTIINIGKAPEKEAREDLLFLEVWKEEVNSDSELTKFGGEGQASIPNVIKDERYPIETSHRVALKWRIRHVADVDFDKSVEGFNIVSPVNPLNPRFATVQGALSSPIVPSNWGNFASYCFYPYSSRKTTGVKELQVFLEDTGLNVGYSNGYKTYDGYVYAIPMFRLNRKPSCGKSIPFEYKKINPKVDYSKFTALMKEEKVERVVNETIKGNSLVNLIDMKAWEGYKAESNSVKKSTGNSTNESIKGKTKLGAKYTLIFEVNDCNTSTFTVHGINGDTRENTWVRSGLTNGKHKILITEDSTQYTTILRCYSGVSDSPFELKDMVVLEGDWTNREIPEYFEGIKSLGEEEHNLIEVKTGVIDENTYDPCDGNVKLSTAPNVTHVVSENTIVPTIEAEVKRGDTKLSDLTTFGKLETVGDETIELTKIKGRTLQNLLEFKNINNSSLINSSKEIVVNGSNKAPASCAFGETPLLKSNTEYTVFVNIKKSTNYSSDKFVQLTFGNKVTQIYLGEGVKKVKFTTPSEITSYDAIFYFWEDYQVNEGSLTIGDFMLFEGDHTQTPIEELPYVEGIKSVGETEDNKVVVKRCAKNLFNKKDVKIYKGLYFNRASNGTVMQGTMTASILFKNIPNTRLVISKKPTTRFAIAFTDSDTLYANLPINNLIMNGDPSTELLIKNSGSYKYMLAYIDHNNATDEVIQSIIDSIQLEEVGSEISQATPFEPYKEYKQEIHLKEPLRSLPNGVCDEIVGNKVIRRIKKLELTSIRSWKLNGPWSEGDFVSCYSYVSDRKKYTYSALCDKLPVLTPTMSKEGLSLEHNTEAIYVTLSKSKITGSDLLTGFKEWISKNPITVYYELANPIEKEIPHPYGKESIKTYQLDEPLRGLPNGVKDEIKDGVLIRRCKEIILNGSENWGKALSVDESTYYFTCPLNIPTTGIIFDNQIADKLPIKNPYTNGEFNGIWCLHNQGESSVRIKLIGVTDVVDLKSWLQENPVKFIYEMATPTETTLTEVHSSATDFSHKKHFKEGNFLREIPGGVKDEVVSNKVITRLGRIKLTGSETWTVHTSHNKHLSFGLAVGTVNSINMDEVSRNTIISDKLPTSPLAFGSNDVGGIRYTNSIYISIDKTLLATPDATGFKAWLNKNPVTVIYELASYTEAEKTAENGLINPCHPFNTYCGSMYVGNGINEVLVENAIPKSGDIIINTPFREISGRDKVNDCRYKKVAEGYDTMDKTSKSANLVDTRNFVNFVSTPNVAKVDTNVYPITLKSPKIKFSIFSNGVAIADDKFAIRFCDKDLKEITWWAATKINREVELVPNFREIAYIRLYHNNLVSTNKTIDGICITYQDGDSSKLVPFVPCEVAFENTEENDIEDLRHQVSLTGFNYDQVLNESFDKLLRGEL